MAGGVLLLTGPPGSGKTTTARMIATAAARGVHIETDRFFHFVRGGWVEPWLPESHQQNVVVMDAVAAAASAFADGSYATVVDGIISPKWFFAPLRDALRARGLAVSCAILRPPLDTCIARVRGRPGGELSDINVVTQLWKDFVGIGALERNVIEDHDGDPQHVADAVNRRWQAVTLQT